MEWKARRRPREEGTWKTPQRSEEASGPPAGKRSAWNGNQPDYKFSFLNKNRAPTKKALYQLVYSSIKIFPSDTLPSKKSLSSFP
ncbi:hypothetical protein FZC75_20780 [Sutcliffiella horikoshii]|uniref:Uncharacterized protein n=1 Tax=Sutcliffiella horikoshii TaxID=79883 RepID=A0A5D4SMK4_9BACI|nr:hypothetical protein FZC75_20780 [Sutcliffiella horikoshii]